MADYETKTGIAAILSGFTKGLAGGLDSRRKNALAERELALKERELDIQEGQIPGKLAARDLEREYKQSQIDVARETLKSKKSGQDIDIAKTQSQITEKLAELAPQLRMATNRLNREKDPARMETLQREVDTLNESIDSYEAQRQSLKPEKGYKVEVPVKKTQFDKDLEALDMATANNEEELNNLLNSDVGKRLAETKDPALLRKIGNVVSKKKRSLSQ